MWRYCVKTSNIVLYIRYTKWKLKFCYLHILVFPVLFIPLFYLHFSFDVLSFFKNNLSTLKIIIIIIIIIITGWNTTHKHIKARLGESLKKKWKNKVLHGQYIRNIDRQLISEEDTFL